MQEQASGVIQDFSLKGYGTVEGVEIAHTVPGDHILYELTRKKRLPQKGRLLAVLEPSSDRVESRCAHSQTCGGCCWQQISYQAQLREKQERVRFAFKQTPSSILPSKEIFGYRNKMEFSFSENRAGTRFLGLMIAQAEPYVFNVTECHLASPWFARVLNRVRHWWEQSSLKAYDPPKNAGSLRYLTLREAKRTDQKMVVLNVSGNPEYALRQEMLEGFVQAVSEECPDASIFLRIHQTQKGRPTQFFEMHLQGPDHILEKLHLNVGTLQFKISPISFFQPNTLSAETLYNEAIASVPSNSTVYDLYCGTGTLGMAASKNAKQVIGVELSPEAVLDAKENCKINQIENMTVIQGDVGKVLKEYTLPPPDVLIVDPPRAGLDDLALSHVKQLKPPTLIYISCNPLTQAKNIEELKKIGYKIQKLQPVDQFPHTYHIENIAVLEND